MVREIENVKERERDELLREKGNAIIKRVERCV